MGNKYKRLASGRNNPDGKRTATWVETRTRSPTSNAFWPTAHAASIPFSSFATAGCGTDGKFVPRPARGDPMATPWRTQPCFG
eukprot:3330586-Lingulodinium_polyedra.AAC.1